MPDLFDSHTHLHTLEPPLEPDAVLEEARAAGVRRFLTLGVNVADSRRAIALAERHPDVYAAAGIHPNECAGTGEADVTAIRELLDHPRVVAVGEIGLDYHWDFASPEQQHENLRQMLRLAMETGLPVVFHNRESADDLVRISGEPEFSGLRGVLHCYAGPWSYAVPMLERGFFVSFAGNVTFKKYADTAVVPRIPADRLLVETDTPYLAPVPHRGKPNAPRYLPLVAERVAELRDTTAAEVAALTFRNTAMLFGVSQEDGSS